MSIRILAIVVLMTVSFHALAQDPCLVLDVPEKPIISAAVSYVGEADVTADYPDLPKPGMTEFDAQWEFAYFRDIWGGDVDLDAVINARVFSDRSFLRMPDQLINIYLDAGWARRYENNLGCQIRLRPGLYSDFEQFTGKALAVPARLMGVYTISPDMSVVLGADVRFGFERVVMPVAGLTWAPSDTVRIDARVPEARLGWYFDADWIFEAGWLWRSDSYQIRESNQLDREMFTMEEQRAYLGLTHWMSDFLSLSLQAGLVFDRTMEFKKQDTVFNLPRKSEIDDAFFVSLTIGGPFL